MEHHNVTSLLEATILILLLLTLYSLVERTRPIIQTCRYVAPLLTSCPMAMSLGKTMTALVAELTTTQFRRRPLILEMLTADQVELRAKLERRYEVAGADR